MGRSRSRERSRSRGRDRRDNDTSSSRSHRDDRGRDKVDNDRYRPSSSRERGRDHPRDHYSRHSSRDRDRDRYSSRERRSRSRSRGREREKERDRGTSGMNGSSRPPRDDGRDRRHHEDKRHDDKAHKRDLPREKESSSPSRKERDKERHREEEKKEKDHGRAKEKEEEDEEEEIELPATLGLDEEDEEEKERRLIEERKRKRQEILAKHQQKEKERVALNDYLNQQDGDGADDSDNEDETSRDGPASKKSRRQEDAEDDDDDVEEEGGGPVEMVAHDKQLSDDDDEADAEKAREDRPGVKATMGMAGGTIDIFSSSPVLGDLAAAAKAGGGLPASSAIQGMTNQEDTLEGNWDDGEGYYRCLVGEVMAERYQVLGGIGRGVFSTVLRCQDIKANRTWVAIKMIRNNEVMRKAAAKELQILRSISDADPDNKKHCVRLLHHFEHRNHVALVFESMQMNLRETLGKFGKHVGINIAAVRTYSKQLLVALKHLASLGIVHADIKPDNILVSENYSSLKICDFGSAFYETDSDNAPTPYLVSRFYRAPEIILGFEYDRAVDLWSIGCCLYELFTGHVAFMGENNNHMLKLMMDLKGSLNQKLVRRHRQAYERLELEPYFEGDGRFRYQDKDPVTKQPVPRLVPVGPRPVKDISAILTKAKTASDDRTLVQHLADLLDKMFTLDASKRITVKEALQHPFVSSSAAANVRK